MIQNIGSIKTLRKQISPKIFLTFSLLFFGGITNFFVWGIKGVASYEVGFICFMIVFLSLFASMNSRLKNTQNQEDYNFSQKFSLGLGVSFSLYRIFSYAFLVVALIGLIELGYFSLYSYMIGIFISLLASFYRYY